MLFLEFNGMHFKETLPNWRSYSFRLRTYKQAHVRLETKSARGGRETRKWPDPRGSGAWLERDPARGLILLILITSLLSTLLQTSTRSFWQQSGHCTTKIAYFSVPGEYIRQSAEPFDAQMKCFVFLSSVIVLHTRPLVRLNFQIGDEV